MPIIWDRLKIFTPHENILLEAELFTLICKELKEHFRTQHREYFKLMKFTVQMEDVMLENNFICFVIKDILSTGEYTIDGIASYIDMHEDTIHEAASGLNPNPSAKLLRKTIELHRIVRSDLYRTIINKLAAEHLAVA